MLHTEYLSKTYGNISINVLKYNDTYRESNLLDSKNILRTYAITFLNTAISEELKLLTSRIGSHEFIGGFFKKNSFSYKREIIYKFIVELPHWLREEFKDKSDCSIGILSKIYVQAGKDSKLEEFGTLYEVSCPHFYNTHPVVLSPAKERHRITDILYPFD